MRQLLIVLIDGPPAYFAVVQAQVADLLVTAVEVADDVLERRLALEELPEQEDRQVRLPIPKVQPLGTTLTNSRTSTWS